MFALFAQTSAVAELIEEQQMNNWERMRMRADGAIRSLVAAGALAWVGCSGSPQLADGEDAVAGEFGTRADALDVTVVSTPAVDDSSSNASGASGGAERAVWVVMRQKAALANQAKVAGWKARGDAVVKSLQSTAQTSQASLMGYLRGRGIAHKAYWAVNAVKVTADENV